MSSNPRQPHFQMLRSYTLADLFTLSNAASGTLCIFLCLEYLSSGKVRSLIWFAMGLLVLALVFDLLDGYVARRGKKPSVLGADLDSLADVVSFGVAPAVLGYTLGLRETWDILFLVYFVVCGISRLARFNVTLDQLSEASGKVPYYEGTPIPTSLLLVGLLATAFHLGHVDASFWLGIWKLPIGKLHPFALLYAASGTAMISSSLRIPKF